MNVKEQHLNILSTNAAGLINKAEDLKNKIKLFNSGIFAIQETHFRKKGRFRIQNYCVFESIRKNKEKGGSMLGVHVGLNPVLIQEYNDTFELIVVEVKVANKEVRVITGYGPQENLDLQERTAFYTSLEEEISAVEIQGRTVIIAMDANAKLGPELVPGDPYEKSPNGSLLSGIVERHALCVVNGMVEKRDGIITRAKNTTIGLKQSVIDFVIVSNDLVEHIMSIHVDEKRIHVLTKNVKNNKGLNAYKVTIT